MKIVLVTICICFFASPYVLFGDDYYIQWADTIDNGAHDHAFGVAVDGDNNIIVTGSSFIDSNNDFFTVKYASDGSILWADTIDNSGVDEAYGMAVDNDNNIIVTGRSQISGVYSYYTVKYPASGPPILWADTIINLDVYARGGAVDDSNNIIVTGYITSLTNYTFAILTIKYDPNGVTQWADTIDGGGHDKGYGIAVDNANNIIVTGVFEMGGNTDYLTVKYAPDGAILWADTMDNGICDIAYGVAVDGDNNIVVTGSSSIGGNDDYFTVKYNPNGVILWADTIDGGANDYAFGVAVDGDNNIIVTGSSDIGGNTDYYTVKYDPNGTILWADALDNGGVDEAHAVAVLDDNIIVTGTSHIGGNDDYLTVEYAPSAPVIEVTPDTLTFYFTGASSILTLAPLSHSRDERLQKLKSFSNINNWAKYSLATTLTPLEPSTIGNVSPPVPAPLSPGDTPKYDTGVFNNGLGLTGTGTPDPNQTLGFATYFSLSEFGITGLRMVGSILINFWSCSGTDFRLYVWDNVPDTLKPNSHDTHLYSNMSAGLPPPMSWGEFDLSAENIILPDTFWIGLCYTELTDPADWYLSMNTSQSDNHTFGNLSGGADDWSSMSGMGYGYPYGVRVVVEPFLMEMMWVNNTGVGQLIVDSIVPSEDWIISQSPSAFEVTSEDSQGVEVMVNASGLANGTYYAELLIYSNDASNPIYTEPVKLIVDIQSVEENESNRLSSSDIVFYPVSPNPTTRTTNLCFVLQKRSTASLKVYNILGQHVKTFFDGPMEKGKYDLVWQGMDNRGERVSSGTYFFMLKAEDAVICRRVVLF